MRTISVAALLVAAALVLTATVLGQADRNRARADTTRELTASAERYSGAVAEAMRQVQLGLLTSSRQPAFEELLLARQEGRSPRRVGVAGGEARQALKFLQHLLPGAVSAAGVLDTEGRNVLPSSHRGTTARRDSDTPIRIFEGAITVQAGSVYQSAPYRSPATGVWVITYAAPVDDRDQRLGLTYVQMPVVSLRRLAGAGESTRVRLVDNQSGSIIVDSQTRGHAGAPLPRMALPPGITGHSSGVLNHGSTLAFRWVLPMVGSPNQWLNPNHWIVVATSINGPGGLVGAVHRGPLAIFLAAIVLGSLGLVGLRRSRRVLHRAANYDALTGLYNRRALVHRLAKAASSQTPVRLVLYDLNGFKAYNDNYGHQAGDALLERLGRALREACEGVADTYRLGGDEFCVVCRPEQAAEMELLGAGALCERGHGFEITASWGAANLPADVQTADELLRLADQRMYEHKRSAGSNPAGQTREALLRLLAERDPDLARHQTHVAQLAARTAGQFDLGHDFVRLVRQAAELHDLGKVALPDSVLRSREPLKASERRFVERHPAIAERILLASPALASVAGIVRSCHECHDGTGYPDGLAGDAIPLGARIIAICDALDELTNPGPGRVSLTPDRALTVLRGRVGTHFDPAVLDTFEAGLLAQRQPHSPLTGLAATEA